MSKMSRTKEEYFANSGWSSHHFMKHAQVLIPELEKKFEMAFGRHVIHLKKDGKTVAKFYVHKNGRSREYATLTDAKGKELLTVHHSVETESFREQISKALNGLSFNG